MRPTDRTRFRKDAEAKFPIKVDIAVAYGQPWPYADMLARCRANVAAGAWAQHGFRDRKRRDDQGIPIDVARWYFMSDADAGAFMRRLRHRHMRVKCPGTRNRREEHAHAYPPRPDHPDFGTQSG